MRGARSAIRSVAFNDDGSQAMVLSADGTMRQYSIFATLSDLAAHEKAALPRQLTSTQRRQFWLLGPANE